MTQARRFPMLAWPSGSQKDAAAPLPSPANAMPRDAGLDTARALLMVLGVALHSAGIYGDSAHWLVSDTARSVWFDRLAQLIHLFRMPAFFWISGYFCAWTLSRHGASALWGRRMLRIALPLLAAWMSLNTIQEWALAELQGRSGHEAVANGVPLFHLWFLVDVLVCTVVVWMLAPASSWLGRTWRRVWAVADHVHWSAVVVALALLNAGLMLAVRATGLAYQEWWGLSSLYRVATYLPFFLAGAAMCLHAPLRERFLSVPVPVGLAALMAAWWLEQYPLRGSGLMAESALVLKGLLVWFCVAGMIRWFRQTFSAGNRWTHYLSDAAYTVFLFHHLLVVLAGYALLGVDLGAGAKFTLVCGFSLLASLAIHEGLIRRVGVAAWVFNGRGKAMGQGQGRLQAHSAA